MTLQKENAHRESFEKNYRIGSKNAARAGRVMIGAWLIFAASVVPDDHAAAWVRAALAVSVPIVFYISLKFMRGHYRTAALAMSACAAIVTGAVSTSLKVDPVSLAKFLMTGVNPLSVGVFALCLVMYVFPSVCFIMTTISIAADKNIKLFCRAKCSRKTGSGDSPSEEEN